MESGNLNFLETSGPLQACNGTALPFTTPCEVLGAHSDVTEEFRDVTLCHLVSIYWRFERSLCLHLPFEAVQISGSPVCLELFDREDGGITILRSLDYYLPVDAA